MNKIGVPILILFVGIFGAMYLGIHAVVKAMNAVAVTKPAESDNPGFAAGVLNEATPCDDGANAVALDSLPGDLSDLYGLRTEEEVECKRTELSELEAWAKALPEKTHDEVCVKKGYLHWIAFYRKKVSQSEYDIQHPSNDSGDSVTKYERSIKEYKATHEPVPEPPPVSCDR